MLTYEQAQKEYASGRKDKVLGRTLRGGYYLQKTLNNTFEVKYSKGFYEAGTDPITGKTGKAHLLQWVKDKTKWEQTHIATIYEGHVTFNAEIIRSHAKFFRTRYGLTRYAGSKKTSLGFDWSLDGGKTRFQAEHVYLYTNTYTPYLVGVDPPKERVFNKEKQKALNDKIKAIRRFFRVRAKLGVFNNFDPKIFEDEYHQIAGEFPIRHWYFESTNYKPYAENVLKMFDSIDPTDVHTFEKLVWVLYRRKNYRYDYNAICKMDWGKAFESYLRAIKEGLRIHTGAVEYVSTAEK